MIQPEELARDEPLLWSPGTGTQVWQLILACSAGDLETVRSLLRLDPALARSHYHYRTPLYFAVRENRLAVAALLLEHGADPLGLAVNDSLLEITRDRGYAELEQLLTAHYASVRRASPLGEPVAAAIRERDPAKVRRLLDDNPDLLEAGDRSGNRPIHWAVMTRQLELIDELLARGADLNAQRQDGARPLHLFNGDYGYRGWRDVPKAVTTTPRQVLDHLIARGATVDIWTACHLGDLARVRALLDADPSLANRLSDYVSYYLGCGSPLRNAAAGGHLEIVTLLLERGADPNLKEEHIAPKGHALYSAVYHGHYEIARLLLEHGAYPSPPVESSADALSIALMNKDDRMIELLCSYGSTRSVDLLAHYGDLRTAAAVFAADPRLANSPGALASAAANGHESFVRLLLRYQPDLARRVGTAAKTPELTLLLFEHGMDPSHRDWLDITPLHELARKGDLANAGLFLDHGADLEARDEDIASTPLGWAAKFGRLELVRLLLDRGARADGGDGPPWASPLAWAERRGHGEIAAVLRRAGSQ